MKRLLVVSLWLGFLAGCASQPLYTDNGNSGQIKAVVFYDDNKNGVIDGAETGFQTQVALSQEVSCPPTGKPDWVDTDASGVHVYQDLKPGKYCVFSRGGGGGTTRLTQEVYVSSDQTTTVVFGEVRP